MGRSIHEARAICRHFSLESPPIRFMSAASARRSAGSHKSLRGAPANATKRRSLVGATTSAPPSKAGGSPALYDPLHRRARILSPTPCNAHLCPNRPNPRPAGVIHPRPFVSHLCPLLCGEGVLLQPGLCHQCRRCGRIARTSHARGVWPRAHPVG